MAQQQMKSLAKDTAIYGLSSIIGKFLNWLLVPLYTYVLASSADYGVVTNLYSWTALMLVVLTYGMETGFFRFANSADEHADTVYGTSMTAVGATSIIFTLLLFVFAQPVANFLGYAANPEYIYLLGAAVAVDAFASLPFAWLRYKKRPVKFAVYKLLFVFFNIFFNLFFLIACPYLMEHAPSAVDWFYDPNYGVGYVIVANIISTVLQTLFLIPHIVEVKFSFDGALLKKILRYSLPLLVLGIAGIMNQTLDKILFPFIKADGVADLGIYGATSKMALIMLMFTQAFRYAYEPFVFAQQKSKDSTLQYALAMKYFVIVSWLIFLGMVFYLDIFKYLIRNDYWQGLQVVPIVLLSFIFQGIYFNLSIWYKLVDKTMYGAWFSILGTIVIVVGNFALVPLYSYWGCAWAAFACYFVMMLVSYFVGQKYMPIAYDLRRMGIYTVSALGLYALSFLVDNDNVILFYGYRTMLFLVFVCIMIKLDLKTLVPAVKAKFMKK